jgi:hypothetical protein
MSTFESRQAIIDDFLKSINDVRSAIAKSDASVEEKFAQVRAQLARQQK